MPLPVALAGIQGALGLGQLFGGLGAARRARRLQREADKRFDEAAGQMDATARQALRRSTGERNRAENQSLYASDLDRTNRALGSGLAAARTRAGGAGLGNLSRNLISATLDAQGQAAQADARRFGRQVEQDRQANAMELTANQLGERSSRARSERSDRQAQAASQSANALIQGGLGTISGAAGGLMQADAYSQVNTGEGIFDKMRDRRLLRKARVDGPDRLPAVRPDFGSGPSLPGLFGPRGRAEGGYVPGDGAGDRVPVQSTEGNEMLVEPNELFMSKADEQYILEPLGGEAPENPRQMTPDQAAEVGYRVAEVIAKYDREMASEEVREEAMEEEEQTGVPPSGRDIRAAIGARMRKGLPGLS